MKNKDKDFGKKLPMCRPFHLGKDRAQAYLAPGGGVVEVVDADVGAGSLLCRLLQNKSEVLHQSLECYWWQQQRLFPGDLLNLLASFRLDAHPSLPSKYQLSVLRGCTEP